MYRIGKREMFSSCRVLVMDHGYPVNSLQLLPLVWFGGQLIVNARKFLVKDIEFN